VEGAVGPSVWLIAVRWTSHSAPFQAIMSVFSLCRHISTRQSRV